MKRSEAVQLIGHRVSAWTAANGSYVGTLVAVTDGKPWRGKVLIDGVTDAPNFEYGRRFRRGFRPGEEIEVGGVNIKPTDEPGKSYADVLRAEIAMVREWQEQRPMKLWTDTLQQLEEALAREASTSPVASLTQEPPP